MNVICNMEKIPCDVINKSFIRNVKSLVAKSYLCLKDEEKHYFKIHNVSEIYKSLTMTMQPDSGVRELASTQY